jgi:hypothetical protein
VGHFAFRVCKFAMADLQTTLQLLEQLLSQGASHQARFAAPAAVPPAACYGDLISLGSILTGQSMIQSTNSLLSQLPMTPSNALPPAFTGQQHLLMLPPPARSHSVSQNSCLSTRTTAPGSHHAVSQTLHTGSRRSLSETEKLVVLVKIVLKCLDRSGDPTMKSKVKAIVADCTSRNRMGDPAYTPLRDACKIRLRRTVGELHWSRVKLLYSRYCLRHGVAGKAEA